jgi:hypothetical protein
LFIGLLSLSSENATESLRKQRLVTVVKIAWINTVMPYTFKSSSDSVKAWRPSPCAVATAIVTIPPPVRPIMHRTIIRSSLPKDLTMKMRVYMRMLKVSSASAWKVMPSPRIRGTLLSPARAGSDGGALVVADMLAPALRRAGGS